MVPLCVCSESVSIFFSFLSPPCLAPSSHPQFSPSFSVFLPSSLSSLSFNLLLSLLACLSLTLSLCLLLFLSPSFSCSIVPPSGFPIFLCFPAFKPVLSLSTCFSLFSWPSLSLFLPASLSQPAFLSLHLPIRFPHLSRPQTCLLSFDLLLSLSAYLSLPFSLSLPHSFFLSLPHSFFLYLCPLSLSYSLPSLYFSVSPALKPVLFFSLTPTPWAFSSSSCFCLSLCYQYLAIH